MAVILLLLWFSCLSFAWMPTNLKPRSFKSMNMILNNEGLLLNVNDLAAKGRSYVNLGSITE